MLTVVSSVNAPLMVQGGQTCAEVHNDLFHLSLRTRSHTHRDPEQALQKFVASWGLHLALLVYEIRDRQLVKVDILEPQGNVHVVS